MAVGGVANAEEPSQPPTPRSIFTESVTVTFAGMEEALQSATIHMLEKQAKAGLEIATPAADLAEMAADAVAGLVTR